MGSSADLKLYKLLMSRLMFANGVCWTGYGTGGSNTPLLPELSELSLIESFQDYFSYLYCALKRSLGLALPREASCSTSSSKPGVNLLLL